VCAAELRHRIVAVLVEDFRVESIGALLTDAARHRIDRRGDLVLKFVEKEAAERFGRAGVARE
jgi:hypothetical protein